MEFHTNIHSCQLVGQVSQHKGKCYLLTLVRVAHSTQYFFPYSIFLLTNPLLQRHHIAALNDLTIHVGGQDTAALGANIALRVIAALH